MLIASCRSLCEPRTAPAAVLCRSFVGSESSGAPEDVRPSMSAIAGETAVRSRPHAGVLEEVRLIQPCGGIDSCVRYCRVGVLYPLEPWLGGVVSVGGVIVLVSIYHHLSQSSGVSNGHGSSSGTIQSVI